MNIRILVLLVLVPVVPVAGCVASPQQAIFDSQSAVQQRSYQQRKFATADKQQTLRTLIATLQDLGFVIDKADATLGSVSASKLDDYELRVTATVRARGEKHTLVRVNAAWRNGPVTNPVMYQDFFTALEKAMFLTAQQVD
jgi:hypothetical protein